MSELLRAGDAGYDPFAENTVSLAELLDEVDQMLSRFVAFPSAETRIATVLWIAHTHALDAFDTTPRLAFMSPEPGSGKTRALEIVELLVWNPILTVNASPAYLIRRLADSNRPVILFDEIDTVFGPKAKADNEDIRGLINSGYRAGATSGRCVIKAKGVETEDFPSFAAVAMAGLDDLPDTIATRAVIVRMRRRSHNEKVSPYRRRLHEPAGHDLRDRLHQWITDHDAHLADAWPELPEGIEDRDADVWEPLIAVADLAGGRWPEVARVSAVSLVSDSQQNKGGMGILLLSDIRKVFNGQDFMGTVELLKALHDLEEAPWESLKGDGLDARGLAWRLGKYGITPKQVKAINRKGYRRSDLEDAWDRYLPPVKPDEQAETASDNPITLITTTHSSNGEGGSVGITYRESETAETNETGCILCGRPTGYAYCPTCDSQYNNDQVDD